MKIEPDFAATFEGLRAILKPYAEKLIVTADTSQNYMLDVNHVMKNKHRLFFAGVRVGKGYVSFHLMPVYTCPELLGDMSAELKRRMQGKSCFNFTTPDEKLFKELGKLTKKGFARFNSKKVLSAVLTTKNLPDTTSQARKADYKGKDLKLKR